MTIIKTRRGTSDQWRSANTLLAEGERSYETDTGIEKIGNGSTRYNALAPVGVRLPSIVVAPPTGDRDTDTASVIAAQDKLRSEERGNLVFRGGPQPYRLAKNTVQVESYWHLSGPGARLRLADGENGDLVRTKGYDAAVAANSGGGAHSWSLADLILDGSRDTNTSGDLLKIYGFDFRLRDLELMRAGGKGIVSRWREGQGFYDAIANGDVGFCESFLSRTKIHDNNKGGIDWDGPHDPAADSVYVYFNGTPASANPGQATSTGVRFGPEAYAPEWRGLHIYGNHHLVGLLVETQYSLLTALQSEGAQEVQVRIKGGGTRINGGHIYNAGADAIMNVARGIEIGHGGVYVDATDIKTTLTNCFGGAVVPLGEGSNTRLDLSIFQGKGTVFPTPSGPPNPTRQITFSQNGGAALGTPGGRNAVKPGTIAGAIVGALPVFDGNGAIIGYQAVYDVINPAVSKLDNPNFEDNVNGWTATQDANMVGSFVRSTDWASRGKASGYYTVKNNGTAEGSAGPISNIVPATAGHKYKAAVSSKLLDEVIPGDLALVVSFVNAQNEFISNSFTTVYGDPGLKNIETPELTAPAGTAGANVRVQVQAGPGETKRFYIDNVLLYDMLDVGVAPASSGGSGGAATLQDTGWRKIYGVQGYWEVQLRRSGNTVEIVSSSYEVPIPYAKMGLLLSSTPGFKPNQGVGDIQFWAWYFPNDTPIRMVLKADGTVAYAGPATGLVNAPEIPSLSSNWRLTYLTSDAFPTAPYPGEAATT